MVETLPQNNVLGHPLIPANQLNVTIAGSRALAYIYCRGSHVEVVAGVSDPSTVTSRYRCGEYSHGTYNNQPLPPGQPAVCRPPAHVAELEASFFVSLCASHIYEWRDLPRAAFLLRASADVQSGFDGRRGAPLEADKEEQEDVSGC